MTIHQNGNFGSYIECRGTFKVTIYSEQSNHIFVKYSQRRESSSKSYYNKTQSIQIKNNLPGELATLTEQTCEKMCSRLYYKVKGL